MRACESVFLPFLPCFDELTIALFSKCLTVRYCSAGPLQRSNSEFRIARWLTDPFFSSSETTLEVAQASVPSAAVVVTPRALSHGTS